MISHCGRRWPSAALAGLRATLFRSEHLYQDHLLHVNAAWHLSLSCFISSLPLAPAQGGRYWSCWFYWFYWFYYTSACLRPGLLWRWAVSSLCPRLPLVLGSNLLLLDCSTWSMPYFCACRSLVAHQRLIPPPGIISSAPFHDPTPASNPNTTYVVWLGVHRRHCSTRCRLSQYSCSSMLLGGPLYSLPVSTSQPGYFWASPGCLSRQGLPLLATASLPGVPRWP